MDGRIDKWHLSCHFSGRSSAMRCAPTSTMAGDNVTRYQTRYTMDHYHSRQIDTPKSTGSRNAFARSKT